MLKRFFKNLNIQRKILLVFLGLLVFAGAFMFCLSNLSIKRIGDYCLGELSQLSSDVSQMGRTSLKDQAEDYLSSVASSISKNAEAMLSEISDQVTSESVGIEKIYKNKGNFKGFTPTLPELAPQKEGEASSKAYVIDPSSSSSAPLACSLDVYNSADLYKVDPQEWAGLGEEGRKKISAKKAVVSKNFASKNLYDELVMLSNCEYIFQPIYEGSDCISSIYLGTESGVFYKYSEDSSSERYDPRTRDWYKAALNSAGETPVWQNTYLSKTTGRFCITCSKAFKGSDGKTLGVCAVDMYLDDISSLVTKVKIGQSGYNFIVDAEKKIVMHPEYDSVFVSEDSAKSRELAESGLAEKISEGGSGVTTIEIGGSKYCVSYLPMSVNGWTWVSAVGEGEIMKPIDEIENHIGQRCEKSEEILKKEFLFTLFVFAILFFASLVVVYFICKKLSKSLSGPIVRLRGFTKDIGKGDFDLSIPVESADEIGELANSFNLMASNLKKYMLDLERTTAEKEKIHSELMIANKIQRSMLPCIFPAFPERTDLDIYAVMDPAKEIGGDFYDFFFISEDKLALVIADVSGKGVSAALFMVIAKILIKNQLQNGDSPADVFKVVNNRLCENNEAGMFVTCFLGIFDIKTGEFIYSNAGHNPPMLYSKKEKTCTLISEPHGFVLGAIKDLKYSQDKVSLSPGDFLFLYTDGVTEAEDESGRLFTEAKLEEIIKSCAQKGLTIQDMVFHIREQIDKFAGQAQRSDDITMLAFKNFTIVPYSPKNKG